MSGGSFFCSIWDFFDKGSLRIPFRTIDGVLYPALYIDCRAGEKKFSLIGMIDTGAVYSVFNGFHIGSDLLCTGEREEIWSNVPGQSLTVYSHETKIRFPDFDFLPDISLTVRYSEVNISRNLLGRDFLKKFHLAFSEYYGSFDLIEVSKL